MVKTLIVIVPEFSSCASSGALAARRYHGRTQSPAARLSPASPGCPHPVCSRASPLPLTIRRWVTPSYRSRGPCAALSWRRPSTSATHTARGASTTRDPAAGQSMSRRSTTWRSLCGSSWAPLSWCTAPPPRPPHAPPADHLSTVSSRPLHTPHMHTAYYGTYWDRISKRARCMHTPHVLYRTRPSARPPSPSRALASSHRSP